MLDYKMNLLSGDIQSGSSAMDSYQVTNGRSRSCNKTMGDRAKSRATVEHIKKWFVMSLSAALFNRIFPVSFVPLRPYY